MKFNSNHITLDANGFVITEIKNEKDPFTRLQQGKSYESGYINVLSNRYCPCENCYDHSVDVNEQKCNLCEHKLECDSSEGCMLTEAYSFNGPIELLYDMLKRPFWASSKQDYKDVPCIVPYASELDGVETPHKCLYNTLNIEFSMPHGDYYQFVSKLFSIPYIGQFALYPKPDAEEWVLLIPLDNCISYTHWRKLTDWLCDELAIQNKWSAHCLSPCPTEGNSRLHHTISENLAFLFPALMVIESLIQNNGTSPLRAQKTIDPLDHFNKFFDWDKLLTYLGFYRVNDSDWCLPDVEELKPSVRIYDNMLYHLDCNGEPILTSGQCKFEVANDRNQYLSVESVFSLANTLAVHGTGMTVTEYNRSLVGLFEPKREQLDSFVVKSGSQGWDEEVQWIVENQFQANSLNMVYGPSGSFKSFHATDLAACVVTGTPWGTSGVTQGNVIYIAAEGDVGLSKRIKAWELINGQETHNLFRIGQPLALTQSNDFEQLLKVIDFTCRKHGDIKMIVIDTLARCFGNGDENSAKDMGAFIAACDRLKQHTQAAILLVHHTGKNATRGARGNSSLKAALDTEFRIERKHNASSYLLTCTKQKDSEPMIPQVICLSRVSLSDHKGSTSLCRTTSPTQKEGYEKKESKISQSSKNTTVVLSILTSSGGSCSRENLNKSFKEQQVKHVSDGNSRTQLTRAIQQLEKNGQISVDKELKQISLVNQS